MKKQIMMTLLVLCSASVFAISTKAPKKNPNSKLTTDARFGDQAVGGQYQVPMEALSVVENEKSIDDLIGVRKNFNDRIQKSKGFR